jgi:hypothetical protein
MPTYTIPTTQTDGILIDAADWNTDIVENIKYLKAITALFGDGAVVTPAQITSDQNNYAPTGVATAVMLRLSSDAARNITGLSAGIAAGMIALHNVGSFAITLKDENASSTAANRFALTGDVVIATDAVVLLQYDATTARWRMIGSPKTTDAGDLTSGTLAAARLPAGTVIQTVNYQTGAVATGTTTMPFDDTIPQNTEGTEFLSLAITPTNASNKLLIRVVVFATMSIQQWYVMALFQDSTANALAGAANYEFIGTSGVPIVKEHYMTAGTTSATTFKVRVGGNVASTITLNGAGGGRLLGGVLTSSITIQEIAA